MNPPQDPLTIGRLAKAIGVTVETIRFYQRKGLLREPNRPHGSIRHYDKQDIARVQFIKSAQRLGFSLETVSQLLLLEDGTQCSIAAELASRHLEEVQVRIQDLERIETTLSQLLKQCKQHQGEVACPLISALHEGHATHN